MRTALRWTSGGALAVLLAGCGGDGADSPPRDGAPTNEAPASDREPTRPVGTDPTPLDPAVPQARIVEAAPRDGDTSFYPVEIYDRGGDEGIGERRFLRFTFDKPMATRRATVKMLAPHVRSLEGLWSVDSKTFEIALIGDDAAPPLDPQTDYDLDLGELQSSAGDPVGTPRIRFRTAARDEVIEHACIHTLFGPFEVATAVSTDTDLASAPLVGSTHKQFTIALPTLEGAFAGDVRVRFSGSGARTYLLLLDTAAPVAVVDGSGAIVTVTTETAPAACPGIQQRSKVTLTRGSDYRLRIGASPAASVRAIWEVP